MPVLNSRPPTLNRNLLKKTIKPVNFICIAPQAKRVTLVGDFNDWQPDALPLKRRVDGAWSIQVPLGSGHHYYQFLVDGKPVLDPRAQGIVRNGNNEKVSLIEVS
jgi:1,4-alpha-glucan branching enzyme